MKTSLIIFLLFILTFILKGFSGDNPYFIISEKDVNFNVPEGFPKPKYDFKKNKITVDGFLLGRKLFYDPILSTTQKRSCGTCHKPEMAFTDALKTALAVDEKTYLLTRARFSLLGNCYAR